MRLIGVLGGMSWESTALYYRAMNEAARETLGGLHSARILLQSVDFEEIQRYQHEADWNACARILVEAAQGLKAGGAAFLVIATNTMHKLATEVGEGSGLEVLHIADPTGAAIADAGHRTVGLLATRFTMEERFYRDRLEGKFGLEVRLPDQGERDDVHRIIYEELCLGRVEDGSRRRYLKIMERMRREGCDAFILGCTEITMLIDASNSPVPVFDTTVLHARAAVACALEAAE
ncbi:aspartate/glutamate racemase family protein [Oricola cellulosilytica]|uniref:Aspartate/glutamate racemase family protein n=1 Tax=Oricola cellulosilytica TaxID=1429082 RepID=A0A4R0PCA3_9HYPH|nr:aspartate/glutamate racemase family protein [Oricola cellulosilytica]TCD13798.1 aspartate/glutamate racemase family protein [Oricola cellulosilytica]